MNKTASSTVARVRVTERKDLGMAFREARLSRDEELVLRMRYGVSEARSTALEFRGQHDQELSAKLALMEIAALDELAAMGVAPRQTAREAALTQSVIERLKRI